MQGGSVGAAVGHLDAKQNIGGIGLGVLDEDVEIAVLGKDACIQEFVLHLRAIALATPLHEIIVGISSLRILVEIFHVRMRRRTIQIEVVLLDILAVVALDVGQAKEPLLEDRVLAIPQRERPAEALLLVGDAGDAVLAPLVGTGARLVVGEVAPRVAVVAVILAHRAPLAFAQVGSPQLPRLCAGARQF